MSLAIADLTVGLFVMPISSAYAITGNQNSVCIIFGRNLENAIELRIFRLFENSRSHIVYFMLLTEQSSVGY